MGPTVSPMAALVWKRPNARPFELGGALRAAKAGADAMTSAVPVPCPTRATRNQPNEGATAQAKIANVEPRAPTAARRR